MAIKETITDNYHFWIWVRQQKERDSSYGNSFTQDAAKAVQAYYEELSDSVGEDIEFDPIAWCCDWSEYDSLAEAWSNYEDLTAEPLTDDAIRENFEAYAHIIELDNGHVLVQEF